MSDDAHLVETTIDSTAVFDGALLHVRKDSVRLPNGATSTREYIVHPGAVLVAPRLQDGRWIVERQFRYPVGRVILEFPAGKRDAGESALATGQRELLEETGYRADTWTPLGVVHPGVGYTNEAIERGAPRGSSTSAAGWTTTSISTSSRCADPSCSRRSTAGRSPTRRRSPRCSGSRGAATSRDRAAAARARARAGRGLPVRDGRRRPIGRRRRLGAQPARRHRRGLGAGR
jgi:ADP-ribose pyrophosphatase